MKGWKEVFFLFAALATASLFIPTSQAIIPPDVRFIPDKMSMNSSFLMIVNPHPSAGETPTVNWVIFGLTEYSFGGTTRVGDNWICLFAKVSDCSSVLFPYPSYDVPYSMQVNAQSGSQVENNTVEIDVGGIMINSNVVVNGSNALVTAWAIPSLPGETPGTIYYKAYSSDTFTVIKNGQLSYNSNLFGYTGTIGPFSAGTYYIALTSTSLSDFGGAVVKVIIGGGIGPPGVTGVSYDNIVYNVPISPGQPYTVETFRITNTGTENLTDLSVTVPSEISPYLTIDPKKTFLTPNESAYLSVRVHDIQSSMNISVFATLFSGSSELAKIPVDLRVTVYGGQNVSSCAGKLDKELCMGGMCCNQVCVVGAECCQSYDCPTGETCSSSFKCESGITPSDECEGMSDSSTCSTGVCCSEQCVECCTDGDCTSGTCSSFNICETPPVNECDGMADLSGCSDGGVCCSGYCMTGYTCCVDDNCNDWQTCSSGTCVTKGNGGDGDEPAGIDIVTIGLIIGGVAAAAVAGFFVFTKLKKKTGEGDEELEPGEEKDEDEFSDEDFY